jgi:ketosteroid isomerase-like protein
MSEQHNIQQVQQMYEAFGRGDVPTILSYLADDVDWKAIGPESVMSYYAQRSGPEAVGQFFVDLNNEVEYSHFMPVGFYVDGDKVFVPGEYTYTVRRNGKSGSGNWMMIFTLNDDGKVVHWRSYEDPSVAAAALS